MKSSTTNFTLAPEVELLSKTTAVFDGTKDKKRLSPKQYKFVFCPLFICSEKKQPNYDQPHTAGKSVSLSVPTLNVKCIMRSEVE